jgi:hypothetical protein
MMETKTFVSDDGTRTVDIYDDSGNHIRTTDYDADGGVIWDCLYELNESGSAIGWRVFRGSGEMDRRFEVDYDSEGRQSEHREYDGNGGLIRRVLYFYDARNGAVEEHHYDSQGVLRSKSVDELDEEGELVGTTFYDPEGNLLSAPAV